MIIPTYNEAGNIESLLRQILSIPMFDVLVVDDHSPDGTGEVADNLAMQVPGRIAVMHRPGKQGLASAYVRGFAYALGTGYERIFQMDADFSHNPGHLPALRDALDHADVVLGSRYVSGGGTRHWPLRRRLLSRAGSAYAAAVLGLPLRDVTSGFKGFTRRALEALSFDTIHSTGYSFQIEVTYRCHLRGLLIVEVPITFEDRQIGQSKMSGQIVTEALLMVCRLRFDHMRQARKGWVLPWPGSSGVAQ